MNEIELTEFLKKQAELLYGKILDMARISEMSDRSYRQFEVLTKQYVRESFEGVNYVLIQDTKKDISEDK